MEEELKQGIKQSIGHAAYQYEHRVGALLAKLPRFMQAAIRMQSWIACKLKGIK